MLTHTYAGHGFQPSMAQLRLLEGIPFHHLSTDSQSMLQELFDVCLETPFIIPWLRTELPLRCVLAKVVVLLPLIRMDRSVRNPADQKLFDSFVAFLRGRPRTPSLRLVGDGNGATVLTGKVDHNGQHRMQLDGGGQSRARARTTLCAAVRVDVRHSRGATRCIADVCGPGSLGACFRQKHPGSWRPC